MPIYVSAGPEYELHPEGLYPAVCCDVVDLEWLCASCHRLRHILPNPDMTKAREGVTLAMLRRHLSPEEYARLIERLAIRDEAVNPPEMDDALAALQEVPLEES